MKIEKVWGVYWSATGNTQKAVESLTEVLGECLGCPRELVRFTLPEDRGEVLEFYPGELVVVGSPVYAGKLPNKILPDFQTKLKGGGALAVGIVTFGNRSFDNALAELCAVLEAGGFHTAAGAAFVGRHAFTDRLASGRPDPEDLEQLREFGKKAAEKIRTLTAPPEPVKVPGDAEAPYYVPRDTEGKPAVFLKAKPVTDPERCSGCGRCGEICPMGSISRIEPSEVEGICIKCQACVRNCPKQAKSFRDPAFLSHVSMLEQNFVFRENNRIFL